MPTLAAAPNIKVGRPHGDSRSSLRAKASGRRFLLVDGLRGVAAIAVVAYHLNEAISRSAPGWTPAWVAWLFERGYLGVDVFFVISGFVIAYSVRDGARTWGFLGRFAFKRSIRLDPPYLALIGLELFLIQLSLFVVPSLDTTIPTARQVLAHMFYAQNLLGYGDIIPIFWTLCFEIQFYLAYVIGIVLITKISRAGGSEWGTAAAWVLVPGSFLLSLAFRYGGLPLLPGLAADRWAQFFLGSIVYWAAFGHVGEKWLWLTWGAVTGMLVASGAPTEHFLALGISALLYTGYIHGFLETGLASPLLQFLGKISYSLYLIHLPIGWRLISLGQMSFGMFETVWGAWLLFLAAIAVSVFASWLWWRYTELPAINFSKRVALPRTELAPDPPSITATLTTGVR